MPSTQNTWGWTSYTRQLWKDCDGRKLYLGRFTKLDKGGGHTNVRMLFWARRPTAAMRELSSRLDAGRDPADLHGMRLN